MFSRKFRLTTATTYIIPLLFDGEKLEVGNETDRHNVEYIAVRSRQLGLCQSVYLSHCCVRISKHIAKYFLPPKRAVIFNAKHPSTIATDHLQVFQLHVALILKGCGFREICLGTDTR